MRRNLRLLHAAHAEDVELEELNCGAGGGDHSDTGLRIAAIFIILAGSLAGALFPVLAKKTKWLGDRIPQPVFDAAKYFGSGVIVRSILGSPAPVVS